MTVKVFFQKVKKRIKRFIRKCFFGKYYYDECDLRKIKKLRAKALEQVKAKVQRGEKVKVAFFAIDRAVWKVDRVFKIMQEDDFFEPIIIVCPYIVYGEERMKSDMKNAFDFFMSKGYNVISALNAQTNEWLDVEKEINPDIVFFTNPHKLTRDEYYITNYHDKLTCYVMYSFNTCHLYQMHYNKLFHNVLWKYFVETDIHKQFSMRYAKNKGENVIVTGYPKTDIFLDLEHIPKSVWKEQNNDNVKKIVWAPHQTIDNREGLNYSSFLIYADFMLSLADQYKNRIQIAFKPHPILKEKLYSHQDWGKERTDEYYTKWANLPNGQLEESDYEDLFLTSDAMIHDSASFLVEYLFTDNPVAYIIKDNTLKERLNSVGILAYEVHYHISSAEQIKCFMDNIIEGRDTMKDERKRFRQQYLLPQGNQFASENIIRNIKKEFEITTQ